MFKIEILVSGSTLKLWESFLASLLALLETLPLGTIEGGIVYEVKEESNGEKTSQS